MDRTHESMSEAAKDVLKNYVLRDDRRVVSRQDKDAFYEVAAGVMAECVIALLGELEKPSEIDKAIAEINDLIADHPVFLDGSSMTGPEAWVKALGVCVGILTKLKSKAELPKESCDTVSQNYF